MQMMAQPMVMQQPMYQQMPMMQMPMQTAFPPVGMAPAPYTFQQPQTYNMGGRI
jgi:hypothetical protein